MLRGSSISIRITMYVLVLSFAATFCTCYIFFNKSTKDIEGMIIGELKTSALQHSYLIDNFLKSYKERINLLKSRTQMRISTLKFIEEKDKTSKIAKKHLTKVSRILNDAKNSVEHIENIVIFDNNMDYIASAVEHTSLGRSIDRVSGGISLSIKELNDSKSIEIITPLTLENKS